MSRDPWSDLEYNDGVLSHPDLGLGRSSSTRVVVYDDGEMAFVVDYLAHDPKLRRGLQLAVSSKAILLAPRSGFMVRFGTGALAPQGSYVGALLGVRGATLNKDGFPYAQLHRISTVPVAQSTVDRFLEWVDAGAVSRKAGENVARLHSKGLLYEKTIRDVRFTAQQLQSLLDRAERNARGGGGEPVGLNEVLTVARAARIHGVTTVKNNAPHQGQHGVVMGGTYSVYTPGSTAENQREPSLWRVPSPDDGTGLAGHIDEALLIHNMPPGSPSEKLAAWTTENRGVLAANGNMPTVAATPLWHASYAYEMGIAVCLEQLQLHVPGLREFADSGALNEFYWLAYTPGAVDFADVLDTIEIDASKIPQGPRGGAGNPAPTDMACRAVVRVDRDAIISMEVPSRFGMNRADFNAEAHTIA